MSTIPQKYVIGAFFSLVAFVAFLFAGFLTSALFFIPAVGCLAIYLLLDQKYLRCPNCRGFTNLDRLLYARTHIYYCSNCGQRLSVSRRG